MPGGRLGVGNCDVTCDVTLASKPLQAVAKGCLLMYVADGESKLARCDLCNLCQLPLTPSCRGL